MAHNKVKPRAAATGGASDWIMLAGSIGSEDTASPLDRQARRLIATFGLAPAVARVTAELAYIAGGAR